MAPTMKWDHEADAKLFGLFLNVFDMKVSGDMLKKLNAAMGLDPKSQAISHRIGAARKRAAGLVSGSPIKAAPLTPRGPKLGGGSKRSTGKSAGKSSGRKLKDESDSDDDVDTPSPVVKRESLRAGAKRSYQEPDSEDEDEVGEPEKKKVKGGMKEGGEGGKAEENGVEKSFFDGDGGLSDTEADTEPDEV